MSRGDCCFLTTERNWTADRQYLMGEFRVTDRRRWLVGMGLATGGLVLGGPLQAADAFEWRPWPAGKRVPALDVLQLDGSRWRLDAQAGTGGAGQFLGHLVRPLP